MHHAKMLLNGTLITRAYTYAPAQRSPIRHQTLAELLRIPQHASHEGIFEVCRSSQSGLDADCERNNQ